MLIKNSLLSILTSLLKSLFTIKKIFLLTAILSTGYYVKKKFFNTKTSNEKTQSIVATIKEPLPTQVKVELLCFFQKQSNFPKEVIEKIFFFYESTIARKNLLFLSFYQDGFIGPGDGWILQSNPPHFPDCKTVNLDFNLTATFWPANPFIKDGKDEIIIENHITGKTVTFKPHEEAMYVNQIYEEVVKMIPNFQYTDLKECQAINNICHTAHTCKTIHEIEKVSQQLLSIQSEQLRFMLFEQLKIKAYHFWFELKYDQNQTVSFTQTNTIIVHPHFFYWQIIHKENGKNVFSSHDFYRLLTSKLGWHSSIKTILQEKALSFVISGDYSHEHIKYPHPFIIIEKDDKPLRMH